MGNEGGRMEEAGKMEKTEKTEKAGKMGKSRKILCIAAVCLAVVVLVYLGIAFYFRSHYLFHTEINGHDVSGKTVQQAERLLRDDVAQFELELEEINGNRESIAGADIGLEYEDSADLEKILKEQESFLWLGAFFRDHVDEAKIEVSYDADKLTEKIDSLHAVTGEQTPAVSAYPKFDGERYVIEPEQYGTAVQRDALEERIASAFEELQASLDLEAEKCYAEPPYTAASVEVQAACDQMNQYCKAKIIYPMTEEVVVDASVISG